MENSGGWRHSYRARLLHSTASAIVVALLSCAPSPATGGPVEKTQQPVLGGVQSDGTTDAVVFVRDKEVPNSGCTGALIAPNLVLTARHCIAVYDVENYKATCGWSTSAGFDPGDSLFTRIEPERIEVVVGVSAASPNASASARATKFYVPASNVLCAADIGILSITPSIDTIPPLAVRYDKPPQGGESILEIGFGAIDTQCRYVSERYQRSNTIELTGPGFYVPSDSQAPLYVPEGEALVIDGICRGDSGSPALSSKSAVVGVINRLVDLYGQRNTVRKLCGFCEGAAVHMTTLFAHRELIEKAFTESGYVPRREGRPPPSGAGGVCQDDLDCNTGACLTDASRCADSCETQPCGSGFSCEVRGAKHACLPTSPSGCTFRLPKTKGSLVLLVLVVMLGVAAAMRSQFVRALVTRKKNSLRATH